MKLEKLRGRGCEHIYRHPVHKTLYFRRFTTKLGEVVQSLKTKDLAEAKIERDKLLSLNKAPQKKKQKKTLWELWLLFVKRKETVGKSAGTLTSIKTVGKYLEPYFKTMMPDELTTEWWESIFVPETKHLGIKKGEFVKRVKPRKMANARKWLYCFGKELHADGKIPKLQKFVNPDKKQSVGRALAVEEIEDLINFAQNPDLRLAILMASTMGMRRGEIFGLTTDRVDLAEGYIHLKEEDTKTRKARSFTISPACLPEITKRVQSGHPWIFPSASDPTKPLHKDGFKTAWNNLKRMTGIKARFHDLRHTFLTRAFSAPGANPALICAYAGLSLEVAVRVYLHLKKEDSKQIAGLVSYDM